jgi:hypothetical protein
MLSIAYFSLLTIFCKIGYMFCPSQVHIFFLGRIENVCSVSCFSFPKRSYGLMEYSCRLLKDTTNSIGKVTMYAGQPS